MRLQNDFTVELKVELLEHLIETSSTWHNTSVGDFISHAQSTFEGLKGTRWENHNLEKKLRKEERIWLEEVDGSRNRRPGYEEGSRYDTVMVQWKEIWHNLLIKDWQNEVDRGCPWDEVPQQLRSQLAFPKSSPPKTTSATTVMPQPGSKVSSAEKPESTRSNTNSRVEMTKLEPAEKLQLVLDYAVGKAREEGKPDLADAVLTLYAESQENMELAYLLRQVLSSKADEQQNDRFQEYVRSAKRAVSRQKLQREQDEQRGQRAKKLAGGAAVPKVTGGSSDSNAAPLSAREGEKLCTEDHWSSECLCVKCKRDEAEFYEDMSGVADAEHRRKYEEFTREHGLDADMKIKPVEASTSDAQGQKMPEKDAPTKQRATDWPVSDFDASLGGSSVDHTPDAQTGAEQESAEQTSAAPSNARGSLSPAGSGIPSDSGYETTGKQAHHDQVVDKILGDLQHEPVVAQFLQHGRAHSTNANIHSLLQRESALEALKTIITEEPAAKTDLKILVQRLEERKIQDAEADGEQALVDAEDGSEDEIAESSGEDHPNDQSDGRDDEDATPRPGRNLQPRTSSVGDDVIDQANSEPTRWPCPVAKEASCEQWFSSTYSAIRHGRNVHKFRQPSNKRHRRASTRSDTATAGETAGLAQERSTKRQKRVRQTATNESDSDASREVSVLSPITSDTSLAGLTRGNRRELGTSQVRNMGTPRDDAAIAPTGDEAQLLEQDMGSSITKLGQDGMTVLARLEAKMDALLRGRGADKTDEHALISSSESILRIIASLQADALDSQNREMIQIAARFTKTAAKAVINAANSAKRSAEMAFGNSLLLEQMTGDPTTAADSAAAPGAA